MVARNSIRCTVVAVGVSPDRCLSRGAMARDLLPWADPYVAQLIKSLQDEVRHERRRRSLVRHSTPTAAERAESSTSWRISAVR
jgi:hypothetical protein